MLNRSTELSQKDSPAQTLFKVTTKSKSQHGISQNGYPILLNVPVETLTGITSYLDPPSLFYLAQVNKHINHHIQDDNTWRRAFALQFLGIGPEGNLDDDTIILLRRSERSWRQEFITRHVLIRRWERSRNVTTAHVPVYSNISGMRLMSSQALLTSSITYGIVARSLPLTGKVLSGYLDASGVRAGLGIGNPNAEFTPNVSSCAMTSDGGTAKVVWGSRAGHLTFMSAPRAMETSRRSAADIKRCLVADEHSGAVLDVQWIDAQASWVLSAGADSCVKLWDAKSAQCVWASEAIAVAFIPDQCLKVAASFQHGYIVSVHKSGDIHLWTGLDFSLLTRTFDGIEAIVIKCPIRTVTDGYDPQLEHDVCTLSIDPTNASPTILVAYRNDPYFYRVHVDLITGQANTVAFGDPFFGSTSVVVPFFRSEHQQSSFIFAGDHLGCVSLYAWAADASKASPATQVIAPLRKFEAHPDGASVTAIAWNGLTLITGSVRGATYVWDALTFAPLRSFATPVPRLRGRAVQPGVDPTERERVRHILVSPEKDVVFVGVGDRVMAWRAGPAPKHTPGGVRGRHSGGALGKKRGLNSKYIEQMELKQTIQESKSILKEESKYSKRTYDRQREHRKGFNNLGLSEAEAVEYVLMLSRDEAAAHTAQAASSSSSVEEGVFVGDFEDDFDSEFDFQRGEGPGSSGRSSRRPSTTSTTTGVSTPVYSSSSSSASFLSPSVSSYRSGMTTTRTGRPIPRVTPPAPGSHEKIRVSPPYREEPMEAGPEYHAEDGPVEGTRMHIEDHFFPPISANASASTSPDLKMSPSASPVKVTPTATGGSPESPCAFPSAWRVPLRAPNTSRPAPTAWAGPSRISPPVWVAQQQQPRTVGGLEDMDDDLRFALELSLVEARSRGEDI